MYKIFSIKTFFSSHVIAYGYIMLKHQFPYNHQLSNVQPGKSKEDVRTTLSREIIMKCIKYTLIIVEHNILIY